MIKVHRGRGLALAVAGVTALSMSIVFPLTAGATSAPQAAKTAAPCVSAANPSASAAIAHIAGIVLAGSSNVTGGCHKPPAEPPYNGLPPLTLHPANCFGQGVPCFDSNMMMTKSTGPLTVVPIFWDPSGFPMSSSYKSIITGYLNNVAKMSGSKQNVFSVVNEYFGRNGQISYNINVGAPVNDTNPLPTSGCSVETADTTGIYADGTGYSACLDDNQIENEVEAVRTAQSLPPDLAHIYVLYLPKGVESCFFPGSSATNNVCTINYQPTATYCAYHSFDNESAVYANMVYPIYASPTGFTCGSDARYPTVQSPTGNPDADTEISPTSHEITEAITDPDTQTGWFDVFGLENGDECAYIYGPTGGSAGAFFNQTINGSKYLTQEGFSNRAFTASSGNAGCIQGAYAAK
jgi:hypothetical protein